MSNTSRKVRAIAAGAAVFGIGAVATLAAWSDSEFAKGEFSTGSFGIQASSDDQTFADHTTTEGALNLEFESANAMTPGQSVYKAYEIKSVGSQAATVTYTSATPDGDLAGSLTSNVYKIEDADSCNAAANTELAVGSTFDLDAEGAKQYLCMKVTLDENYSNAAVQDGTIVWQFDAAKKA